MATPTYELIDSVVLSSSAASVSFSTINQSYRDLIIVCEGRTTAAFNDAIRMRFNSDSTTNIYTYAYIRASSTTPSGSSGTFNYLEPGGGFGPSGSQTGFSIMQIQDYSSTSVHKTVFSRNKYADAFVNFYIGRWASTTAISSIQIFLGSGNIAADSTFYLYGLSA